MELGNLLRVTESLGLEVHPDFRCSGCFLLSHLGFCSGTLCEVRDGMVGKATSESTQLRAKLYSILWLLPITAWLLVCVSDFWFSLLDSSPMLSYPCYMDFGIIIFSADFSADSRDLMSI